MFEKSKSFLRIFLFFIIAICIWAIWSLGSLINNNPADFQAAGSIIVAWAIVDYGQDRKSREKIRNMYQTNLVLSAIKYQAALLEMHERRAENTANRDALVHFRLLETLGLKDSAVADQRLAIKELEALAEDNSENERLHNQLVSAQKLAQSDQEAWVAHEKEYEPWLRYVARAELVMVVFGTLQWGYGDRWVATVHTQLVPLAHSWLG